MPRKTIKVQKYIREATKSRTSNIKFFKVKYRKWYYGMVIIFKEYTIVQNKNHIVLMSS